MNNSETKEIISKVTNVLRKQPKVLAAILYGSVSSGKYLKTESDVDIAIIPNGELTVEDKLKINEVLNTNMNRDVDIVFISSNLSLILRNEIALQGYLLFSRNKDVTDEFFIKTPQLYEDFMYYRRPLEESYIKRKLDA
jgi:predicted nucleotidyltransferase